MRIIGLSGLACTAAIAVVAIAASAASASVSQFDATTVGKLSGEALEKQVFKTKAGSIECTKVKVEGNVVELGTETAEATVHYESCTALGFISAEVSPALYLLTSSGSLKIEKTITAKATGCTVTIPAQTVKTVEYENSGEDMKILSSVTGLESEGTGTSCTYAKEKEGTVKGAIRVAVSGGKIAYEVEGTNVRLRFWNLLGGNPKVGEVRIVEVENWGTTAAMPTSLVEGEYRVGTGAAVSGFFEVKNTATCRTTTYTHLGNKCNIEVKILKLTQAPEAAVKWEAVIEPGLLDMQRNTASITV